MSARRVKVHLEVPEGVGDQARAIAQTKAHEAAVLALWEAGEMSGSRAAEELSVSIHDFLDLLAAKGIPAVEGGELNLDAIEAATRKLAGNQP